MSKVEELRAKYPKMNVRSFTNFVNADETPTKKYLEYLLKQWSNPHRNVGSVQLVKEVKRFDELLPYHKNKDIYSADYNVFNNLYRLNNEAEEIRDEKNFKREEHVDVIYEDDTLIFLVPKTHKGSLKYGSNTQWCTASKSNPSTFERYSKGGCLAYLVRKKETNTRKYDKIAFYNNSNKPLSGSIEIYNQVDDNVNESTLIKNGWGTEKLAELMLRFRAYHVDREEIKRTKQQVTSAIDAMKNIDLDNLHANLTYLEKRGESNYQDINNLVSAFVNKVEESLKKFKV